MPLESLIVINILVLFVHLQQWLKKYNVCILQIWIEYVLHDKKRKDKRAKKNVTIGDTRKRCTGSKHDIHELKHTYIELLLL